MAALLLSPVTLTIYRVVIAEASRFFELGCIFCEASRNAVWSSTSNGRSAQCRLFRPSQPLELGQHRMEK